MRSMALFVAALLTATPAQAVPPWAPAGTATVHPGVRTRSATTECTANFVFYDASNDVYLGQAARCTATGSGTNGCVSGSRPLGTRVTIEGATRAGTLVYSSWLAMQAAGEPVSSPACAHNDFALVRLDPADYSRVNPTVPFWGGPTGIGGTPAPGDRVFGSGDDPVRGPRPRTGIVAAGDGWTHRVHWVPPGGPADAGMGVLDENGHALGATGPLSVDALPGSSVVVDLRRVLAYLTSHGGPAVTLALGTEPFEPPCDVMLRQGSRPGAVSRGARRLDSVRPGTRS